jgi:hypothetical protein
MFLATDINNVETDWKVLMNCQILSKITEDEFEDGSYRVRVSTVHLAVFHGRLQLIPKDVTDVYSREQL